jgi:hypothetical protein
MRNAFIRAESYTASKTDAARGRVQAREPSSGGNMGDDVSAADKAQQSEQEREEAKETVRKMEEDGPPDKLEDWPDDAAKYETFGGPEGEHPYHEGPEQQLGPSSLRHHDDGKVSIEGEEVDNPEDYKGEPIPGGPTDGGASSGP